MKRKDADTLPAGETVSFEQMMSRLEELVSRLERGDLSLEESIQAFEEGIKLVKQCTSVLGEAEKRIQHLTQEGTSLAGAVPNPEAEEEERGPDELPF
ncbi:MAG TPA: exodeoxyribonuclease VII small subunit [Candidatus Binatia bacterium]|nr:exodeoxyribonuclease VII small subunit [Candidatus Binatia bacterium]